MAKCTVIGGGLSGLTTAYLLSRLGPKIGHICVYDGNSKRFGGCIMTRQNTKTGAYQDLGPHSARVTNPREDPVLRLVSSLGFRPNDVVWLPQAQRYIYAAGGIRALSLFSFKTQPPFSRSNMSVFLRRALENGPDPVSKDISVDNFLRTRFDDEFADYLGTAMCRGICGVDSKHLSVSAFLPKLLKWEKEAPNLILGAAKSMLKSRWGSFISMATEKAAHEDYGLDILLPPLNKELLPLSEASILGFRRGMQSLTDRLVGKLAESPNVTLRKGVSATQLQLKSGRFEVSLSQCELPETSDAVFLCTSARGMGSLLSNTSFLPHEITESFEHEKFPSSSIAVVALEFDKSNLVVPNGFGHLLPTCEHDTILGVIYDSCVFPYMDGETSGGHKTTRFTVMMSPRPEWFSTPERADPFDLENKLREELIQLGLGALKQQLGLDVTSACHVYAGVWDKCIACYPVGHLDNVKRLRDAIGVRLAHEGMNVADSLHLVGSAIDGVGVGDCVKSATKAVNEFVNNL